MTTPIYDLTEWAAAQASPWVAHNAALRALEAVTRGSVSDRDLTAPPGSCDDGAAYLVDTPATGAWAGHEGEMAVALGANAVNGWLFLPIETEGFLLYVDDEDIRIEYRTDTSPAGWVEFSTGGGSGIPSGTAFPGSPATNDRFFRTDRGIEYFYDGTRWLSLQIHSLTFGSFVTISATDNNRQMVPFKGTYSLWLVGWTNLRRRTGAGEWDVLLRWFDGAGAVTLLDTQDGSGDADATYYSTYRALGSQLDANAQSLVLTPSEISGSTTFICGGELHYRLIG